MGSICEFNYGKSLPKNNREHSGSFDVYGSNGIVGKHSKYLIDSPCIIVGRKGAAGEVQISMSPCWPIDTTYYILENPNYELKFLYYLLKSLQLSALDKSTAIPGLNRNDAYEKIICLPPLDEQSRIVAKIEELFSNLDKGIERLKAAQQQLKIYRQSVLKWAFEGRLTSQSAKEASLAESWRLYKLEEITLKIQIGPFGTQLHREDYIKNGIPLINPMHIQNGQITPDENYTITTMKKEKLAEYILREGDIILGRRGEMGRCALVQTNESGWLCGTGCLYIRPSPKILNSKFLNYFLNSETAKKYLEENAAGTTMANLNSKIISCLPIKLPPLSEQQKIVTEIESRLSICDKMEEMIPQNLLQTEALRHSILKQAFEGKLVP